MNKKIDAKNDKVDINSKQIEIDELNKQFKKLVINYPKNLKNKKELQHIFLSELTRTKADNSFTKSDDIIRRCIIEEINVNAFSVYLQILHHRNTITNNCFPSIKDIADELKLSDSAIKRNINALEEKGYLQIKSGDFFKHETNRYYFPYEPFYTGTGVEAVAVRKKISENTKQKLINNFHGGEECRQNKDIFAEMLEENNKQNDVVDSVMEHEAEIQEKKNIQEVQNQNDSQEKKDKVLTGKDLFDDDDNDIW